MRLLFRIPRYSAIQLSNTLTSMRMSLFMLAFVMQVFVFISPFVPEKLRLQDTFCLKLHDIGRQESQINHSIHDSMHDVHDHSECNLCVLHHLAPLHGKVPALSEVKWSILGFSDILNGYDSVRLTPVPFKYPYAQAPPQFNT